MQCENRGGGGKLIRRNRGSGTKQKNLLGGTKSIIQYSVKKFKKDRPLFGKLDVRVVVQDREMEHHASPVGNARKEGSWPLNFLGRM